YLDRVLAAMPSAPASAYIDAYLRTLTESPDALAASRQLVLRHPEFTPGLVNHAFVLSAAGRAAEAADAIERLAEHAPARAALYAAIAAALREQGPRSAAVRAIRADAALPAIERAGWLVVLGEAEL